MPPGLSLARAEIGRSQAYSLTELMSQYALSKLLESATVAARVPLHPLFQNVAPAQSPIKVVLILRRHESGGGKTMILAGSWTYMIICSSSKNVPMSHVELSKVALGVPNSAILGEPFLILAGTSLTLQNQI